MTEQKVMHLTKTNVYTKLYNNFTQAGQGLQRSGCRYLQTILNQPLCCFTYKTYKGLHSLSFSEVSLAEL